MISPREMADFNEESLKAAAWFLEESGYVPKDLVEHQMRLNDLATGFYMGVMEVTKRLKEIQKSGDQ